MRYIPNDLYNEENFIIDYNMQKAVEEAEKSRCKKSQRGAIIVKDSEIIGRGHNKPF